jgi:hypothetical protein
MTCSGSCSGDAGCNTTAVQINNLEVSDSVVNATGPVTVIIQGGNNTNTFDGDEIHIDGSNTTIEAPEADEIHFDITNSNTTVIGAPEIANFITGPPRTCADWADWKPTRSTNFTFNSATWTTVTFTGGEFVTQEDSTVWSLQDSSTLLYNLLLSDPDDEAPEGAAYKFTVCLMMAQLYNPVAIGERLLITLWNATSNTQIDTEAVASTSVFYNHTNPVFLTSACASLITQQVTNGTTYKIAVSGDLGDGSTEGQMTIAANCVFFLSVEPTGCAGTTNNYDLTLNFNNTNINPQCGLEADFQPSNNSVNLRSTGVKSLRTNDDDNLEDCADIQFADSETIAWQSDVDDLQITASTRLRFFKNGTCNAVYTSGRDTTYESSAICDCSSDNPNLSCTIDGDTIELSYDELEFVAGGSCLAVVQDDRVVTYSTEAICIAASDNPNLQLSISNNILTGNYSELGFHAGGSEYLSVVQNGRQVNYTYNGLDRIRVTESGEWIVGGVTLDVGPGLIIQLSTGAGGIPKIMFYINDTHLNTTSCAVCEGTGENATMYITRMCSEEPQCEIRSEPPVSDDPSGVGVPCFACCYTLTCAGSGGGGDDGGGGGAPPPIVPVPPLPPFIIIVVPPIVGAGGGGGGGAPLGDTPAVPMPLVTNCSTNATTEGGITINRLNFTEYVPCCNEHSAGKVAVDNSSGFDWLYICMWLGNQSYAWVPHDKADAVSNGETNYYINSLVSLSNGSSLTGDNTSQIIHYGPAYFGGPTYIPTLTVQDLTVNDSATFINAPVVPNIVINDFSSSEEFYHQDSFPGTWKIDVRNSGGGVCAGSTSDTINVNFVKIGRMVYFYVNGFSSVTTGTSCLRLLIYTDTGGWSAPYAPLANAFGFGAVVSIGSTFQVWPATMQNGFIEIYNLGGANLPDATSILVEPMSLTYLK